MKVSKIFHSIEGEGIEIGRPEVFIRLAGCNLRCTWCDTKYALENGKDMSLNDVINEIARYPCRSVSITGGEPLLQREELLKLVQRLKKMDYWIQINTNGTIFDEEIFSLADLVSMDCKCPSSEMKSDLSVLEETSKLFKKKTQFKFVISDEEDYEYAVNIVSFLLHGASNIIFQPEWNSKEFARKLVSLVKRDNLKAKVILQQQKMIWGEKKGV